MADNYGEALGWQNLAIAYEDLGWFNSCAQAYATAITACERAASMRLGPHLYAGAAGLAMLLGNRDEAEESLTRAVDAGNRLSTPMALIPALLTRADLHIAQHEFELAWPFVEEALSLAGDEPLLSAPAAHLERLRSHFIWQTRGYDALRLVRTHQATPGLANRVSFRLELSAFYDWVDQQEGLTTHESKALNEILRLRLYGSIARLIALGIYPSRQVPTGRPGEPSAALVLRAFPECRQEPLPRSLHDHHPPIA
jgi:tetratricopeptide (TPR) repeat protein